MASNYLVTLAAISEQLLLQTGMDKQQSKRMIYKLMQSNIDNLQQTDGIRHSLTGPLARGDIQTIAQHLQVITDSNTEMLYKTAAIATLPFTNLTDEQKGAIKELLLKSD
jgi:predicted short-subunit dehydrogenase-like oxidoreductase (DUF2520 family)